MPESRSMCKDVLCISTSWDAPDPATYRVLVARAVARITMRRVTEFSGVRLASACPLAYVWMAQTNVGRRAVYMRDTGRLRHLAYVGLVTCETVQVAPSVDASKFQPSAGPCPTGDQAARYPGW
ncbi:hypothetical protein Emed_004426 [Eimeria media]